MFTKVSVLVPTRKRVSRLETMLASYDETTMGAPRKSELIFRIDDDDPETYNLLATRRHLTVVGSRHNGYASTPQFFNELAGFARGDVLMLGNDDMVFRTVGWAPLILKEANKYPDGLFNIGVHTHNEGNYPFTVVSKRVADELGFLFDPRVFWGDIFLRDVMSAFGRLVPLPSVCIDHDWAGHRPDLVFEEGNAERFRPRGDEYWHHLHAAAVHDAVERLKGIVRD